MRRTGWLLVALAVVAAAIFLGEYTGSGAAISQQRYHRIGTTGRVNFSAVVRVRRVVVEAPDHGVADIIGGYAMRLWQGRPLGGLQGEYDPVADEIRILGDEVRLQSRLPAPFRGELYHVVRHEYGHAAFFDWLERRGFTAGDASSIGLIAPGDGTDVAPLPPGELRVVISEYRTGGDVYGDPYLTSTLAEYLAESYARVLEGTDVPPRTKAFIVEEYARR